MEILVVEFDRLATEQIFDPDVPDARNLHMAMDDLMQARDDPRLDGNFAADVEDPSYLLALRLIDRYHDLLDVHLIDQPREIVGRSKDLDPIDASADLAAIVIDESADLEFGVGPSENVFDGDRSDTSGTDEKRRLSLDAAARPGEPPLLTEFVEEPANDTQTEKTAESEKRVDQDHGDRNLPV